MNQSLAEVDAMIGSVMDGLDQRNLTDIINLIVVVCPLTTTNPVRPRYGNNFQLANSLPRHPPRLDHYRPYRLLAAKRSPS